MSDIIIARLQFPNDPTNNLVAHQMYFAENLGTHINLYSVSSILGKEKRVYGAEKDNYVTILGSEVHANGFKVPSFIDCSKMYQIEVSSNVNLLNLTQRNISPRLKAKIGAKISEMKQKGLHKSYVISEADFKAWNSKV